MIYLYRNKLYKYIIMTKEEIINEIIKCRQDPKYFIKNYVYISHPIKGKIPLKTYPFQDNVLDNFVDNRFNIIIKGRQMGVSTITLGYIGWVMLFYQEKEIVLLSIKSEVTKDLIARLQLLFDELPDWLRPKYLTKNKTRIKLHTGSRIKATATTKSVGRSFSASILIVDECVSGDTKIKVKNKKTGEIREIPIQELYYSNEYK